MNSCHIGSIINLQIIQFNDFPYNKYNIINNNDNINNSNRKKQIKIENNIIEIANYFKLESNFYFFRTLRYLDFI